MSLPEKLNIDLRKLDNALELSKYYQIQEFIRQTAAQIQKDFAEFGMEIKFSGDTENAYQELFEQLETHLSHVLDNDFHMLVNMMYRIDLNEKKIVEAELKRPDLPKSTILSDMIIQRELKKVLLRYYFKQHGTE